ncbi:hypothetical protein L6164_029444 [Bauhinia variegata]|uniref:Uncharacterized protein n=1 Tax=Bauhinia variegata TaxID=167791 RepID=A0ACB9L9L7_BAUVA|nr:hypothetical protein L6164_029444 [Bauhinia variegata]
MEDIGVSVASKIAEYLVDPTIRHARYLFCFNNILESFQTKKDNLVLTRDSIQQRARYDKNKTRKIEPAVENWLHDVETALEQVHKLEVKIEASNRCFGGCCHYFLAREMGKRTEKMIKLNENIYFRSFSQPTELPGMKYFSSKNFVYFKSTESACNELLVALRDSNICMMGLHGMGGSGKTSLVKEVGKKAENLLLFDKVIIAVVSQTPNVREIQNQIADQLGLKLEEESEFGRAQRLYRRLENGQTLIILDDLWENLDFEAIGIPSNDNNIGCRVLITTRIRRVCVSMGCTKITELSLLYEEESWFLFKLRAEIADDCQDDFKDVARKISIECKGLPIAIETVGRTLRGKSFEEWELALLRLKESQTVDIDVGLRSPYACLRLSYDNLRNQAAKSLFLLCSIFPEDYKINKEDLFRNWKGLQVPGEPLGKARREVNAAVNVLLDCNLLMPGDSAQYVKMHDLVRDVALWIASEEGQAVMVASSKDARLLVGDETVSQKAKISLWEMVNGQLSDQLNCPKLDTLLLHSKDVGFEVANAYFGGMEALKVLSFIRFSYSWHVYKWGLTSVLSLSLPQSIKSLTSLQTLCLRGYKLDDISILGSLKGLEILDLRGSSFDELPIGISELKKLKLLDLFNCSIAKNNPYEVIGRVSQLEELYIWTTRDHPLENVSLPTLQRYAIGYTTRSIYTFASNPYEFLEKYKPTRALCIEKFDVSSPSYAAPSSSIRDLLPRAESLHLRHLEGGHKNIIPCMDKAGMNHLIGLILESCSEMECLVDSRNTNPHMNLSPKEAVFSELVAIRLQHMNRLEELFRDPSSSCSLKNLQEVRINYCPKLYSISFPRYSNLSSLKILRLERCEMLMSSIFTPSIAQTLVQLEQMNICECKRLKHIINEVEVEEIVDGVSSQSYSLKIFPNLRILSVEGCETLESIFPIYFARGLERLEDIVISRNPKLKYVFGTHKEGQLSSSSNEIVMDINLPSLRRLTLNSLTSLINIYPKRCNPRSPNLKVLRYCNCQELSTITVHKMVVCSDIQQDYKATKEREIFWLVDAPSYQWCNEHIPADLQAFLRFQDLSFERDRVEGIFQLQVNEWSDGNRGEQPLRSNLDNLNLHDLSELQFIWKGLPNFLILEKLRFVKLDTCRKLKNIFSVTIVRSLPKLESLKIINCEELEEIVSSNSEDEENHINQFVCFPELRYLEVMKCDKLKCLFDDCMVSHFPKLATLKIVKCSQLVYAFGLEHKAKHEGRGKCRRAKDARQVVLPKLEQVELVSLLNFTKICQGFKLQQPLKSSTALDCPKYSSSHSIYKG